MKIELQNIKPSYMAKEEVHDSEVYLQNSVLFENQKCYLFKANSGHGKTSILNIIYGNSNQYSGQINYLGLDKNQNKFNLRKHQISYVFQDLKLFPELTVFENIQLKNSITNHKTEDEIDLLIERVLLKNKRNTLIKTLSLGQKQRAAIIRALCQPFEYLLLDEPFSHLDETNSKNISEIINEEVKKQKASIIMTSLGKTSDFQFDQILNL